MILKSSLMSEIFCQGICWTEKVTKSGLFDSLDDSQFLNGLSTLPPHVLFSRSPVAVSLFTPAIQGS